MTREILAAAPSAPDLIALTDRELMSVLLRYVGTDDPTRRMTTVEGTLTSLFEPTGPYQAAHRNEVQDKVRGAWRALEDARLIVEPDPHNGANGYRVISEQGRNVGTDVDLEAARNRAWLKADKIHVDLRGACFRSFANGDYDTAIFEAFKAVEAKVRARCTALGANVATQFGSNLMAAAFDAPGGPLMDPAANATRQRARANLFKGAMGELRNPRAHGDPTVADPLIAIEEIMTASALLRIVG